MLSTKTWLVLAVLLLALGTWRGTSTVEYVYNVRHTDHGVYVSKVICGGPIDVVFFERYEGVLGPRTAADCSRAARTHLIESGGLLVAGLAAGWLGIRHGMSPPKPIDSELPPLPKGERIVEGRRRS